MTCALDHPGTSARSDGLRGKPLGVWGPVLQVLRMLRFLAGVWGAGVVCGASMLLPDIGKECNLRAFLRELLLLQQEVC